MSKFGFDQEALIHQFAEASARGGETLRRAVHEATLKALQGRELTLKNIRKAVQGVTEAASTGAQLNPLGVDHMGPLLTKALAGMDAALLQAVQANHGALQQLLTHGASLRDKQIQQAMEDIDRMEDMFFSAVRKAAGQTGGPLNDAWTQALDKLQIKGTGTGAQASAALNDLTDKAQTALRDSRAMGLKAAQALMDSYAALASGVLIGMTQGLQAGMSAGAGTGAGGAGGASAAPRKAAPRRKAA